MVGQFKDDRVQTHSHGLQLNYPLGNGAYSGVTGWTVTNQGSVGDCGIILGTSTYDNDSRKGNTTRTKQKGVTYIVKVL